MSLKDIKDKPVSDAYADYSHPSSVFIFNYSKKITALTILTMAYPVILLISRVFKHRFFDSVRNLERAFRFNLLWRIVVEIYLEFALNAFMNIYSL